jgi:hypothetical protein
LKPYEHDGERAADDRIAIEPDRRAAVRTSVPSSEPRSVEVTATTKRP